MSRIPNTPYGLIVNWRVECAHAQIEAEEYEDERREQEHRAWLAQRDQKKLAIQAALKTGSYRKNAQVERSYRQGWKKPGFF